MRSELGPRSAADGSRLIALLSALTGRRHEMPIKNGWGGMTLDELAFEPSLPSKVVLCLMTFTPRLEFLTRSTAEQTRTAGDLMSIISDYIGEGGPIFCEKWMMPALHGDPDARLTERALFFTLMLWRIAEADLKDLSRVFASGTELDRFFEIKGTVIDGQAIPFDRLVKSVVWSEITAEYGG